MKWHLKIIQHRCELNNGGKCYNERFSFQYIYLKLCLMFSIHDVLDTWNYRQTEQLASFYFTSKRGNRQHCILNEIDHSGKYFEISCFTFHSQCSDWITLNCKMSNNTKQTNCLALTKAVKIDSDLDLIRRSYGFSNSSNGPFQRILLFIVFLHLIGS